MRVKHFPDRGGVRYCAISKGDDGRNSPIIDGGP